MVVPARVARILIGAAMPSLFAACATDSPGASPSPGAGASGAGAAGGSAGAIGIGGMAVVEPPPVYPPCPDAGGAPPESGVCVLSVRGRAVDERGDPVRGKSITVCGPVCFYGQSDGDGEFVVAPEVLLPVERYSIVVHGRPQLATFYYPLPQDQTGPHFDAGEITVLRLPESGPLLAIEDPAAQVVTSGEVTLSIPDGAEARLDVEDLALGEEGARFRSLRVPSAFQESYVDPSLAIEALYALAPFESRFQTPQPAEPMKARLSFDNAIGLAASARIELLALGSLVYPDWVTPGHFEVVATGSVSGDGNTIGLDPGEGVPYLTWIGIRRVE